MHSEFPASKVNLSGLPPHWFPIEPTTWLYTTALNIPGVGTKKVKISRSQIPIQGGFAVTGQSAQGQTLPVVLCDLNEGSWSSYVAASRAKSREGLFLTEPVSLETLNSHPIPFSLVCETVRFDVFEQNARITWGFATGNKQILPDLEANEFQAFSQEKYHYCYPLNTTKRKGLQHHEQPEPKRMCSS